MPTRCSTPNCGCLLVRPMLCGSCDGSGGGSVRPVVTNARPGGIRVPPTAGCSTTGVLGGRHRSQKPSVVARDPGPGRRRGVGWLGTDAQGSTPACHGGCQVSYCRSGCTDGQEVVRSTDHSHAQPRACTLAEADHLLSVGTPPAVNLLTTPNQNPTNPHRNSTNGSVTRAGYAQGLCITSPDSVDGRPLAVDDTRQVANCRDLLTGKGCAAPGVEGRNVDTLFSRERRVGRKPRTLAVGIPTEVDR